MSKVRITKTRGIVIQIKIWNEESPINLIITKNKQTTTDILIVPKTKKQKEVTYKLHTNKRFLYRPKFGLK